MLRSLISLTHSHTLRANQSRQRVTNYFFSRCITFISATDFVHVASQRFSLRQILNISYTRTRETLFNILIILHMLSFTWKFYLGNYEILNHFHAINESVFLVSISSIPCVQFLRRFFHHFVYVMHYNGVNDQMRGIIIVTWQALSHGGYTSGSPEYRVLIIFITRRPREQLTRNSVQRIK